MRQQAPTQHPTLPPFRRSKSLGHPHSRGATTHAPLLFGGRNTAGPPQHSLTPRTTSPRSAALLPRQNQHASDAVGVGTAPPTAPPPPPPPPLRACSRTTSLPRSWVPLRARMASAASAADEYYAGGVG